MNRDEIKKIVEGMGKIDIPKPKEYNMRELSHVVLLTYTGCVLEKKCDITSTETAKYYIDNGQNLESTRNLYDAAQTLTYGNAALKDISYDLKPNHYARFLEDNLFSIKNFGEWQKYSDIKKAKENFENLFIDCGACTQDTDDKIKLVKCLEESFINTTYALATKNDHIGLKQYVDCVNGALFHMNILLDSETLFETAFRADYNYKSSEEKKMPLGNAGRFIEKFLKKYPDPAKYWSN